MASKRNDKLISGKITCALVLGSWWVYFRPQMAAGLVYDRGAVLCGETWRLFTAPLVHFSFSHLFWDLLVFAASGWVIERAAYRGFWLVCTLATLVPGPLFLYAFPELIRYGGLSGLSTASVVFLCLCKLKERRGSSIMWTSLLLLIGIKIWVEFTTAAPIFISTTITNFVTLPSVHLLGCAAAFAVWLPAVTRQRVTNFGTNGGP